MTSNKIKTIILLVLCVMLASTASAGIFSSDNPDGHMTVDGDVNVTYNNEETIPGRSGYVLSIDYQGGTYYMDANQLAEFASVDAMANKIYQYHEGRINGTEITGSTVPDEFTVQLNDTNFGFDYKNGMDVDGDGNDTIVTTLYYSNGTQM